MKKTRVMIGLVALFLVFQGPANADDLYRLFQQARLARGRGDCQAALGFYGKALKLAPAKDAEKIRRRMAQCRRTVAKKLLAKADAALSVSDCVRAIQLYSRALRLLPRSRRPEIQRRMQSCTRSPRPGPQPPSSVDTLKQYRQAKNAHFAGLCGTALKIYRSLLATVPPEHKDELRGQIRSCQRARHCKPFNRIIGGAASDDGWMVVPVPGRGFVFVGTTRSKNTQRDALWVVLLGPKGQLVWERVFGGTGRGDDRGRAISLTRDGGFIVAGVTRSKGAGRADIWLLKLSTSGELVWDRTFGGAKDDQPFGVRQTADGGFLVGANTSSKGAGYGDLWVLKLDARGRRVADWTYGGAKTDKGQRMIGTRDGGALITGFHAKQFATLRQQLWVLKLDGQGKLQWEKSFGGLRNEVGLAALELTDGYLVAGATSSRKSTADTDAYLLKLTRSGQLVWERSYPARRYDWVRGLAQLADGTILLGIESNSGYDGSYDAILLGVTSQGIVRWRRRLGGTQTDLLRYLRDDGNGGAIAVGMTYSGAAGSSDAWIFRISPKGVLSCL